MNISKWTARVSNWKRQDAVQKPLEYHIAHLHEEVSEVFKVVRSHPQEFQEMQAQGINPFSQVWFSEGGKPEGFGIELADVVLVALFVAAVTGVNLEQQMETKMAYNERKRFR